MKSILKVLLLSSGLICSYGFAQTVYINGKPVPQSVIDNTINQFKKSSPMAAQQIKNPQFEKQILQSIGMQQAILIEGDKKGLNNSPQYKAKLEEVKPMIYAQILQEQANQEITDKEVMDKYNKMKLAAANTMQYEVAHILVRDNKTANDIIAQLKHGAKFDELAKTYSLDTGSKDKGGELGFSDGSNYVPEFTAALKKLQKGKYTTVAVKSQFGYHIIILKDVKKGSSKFSSFIEMKDQIRQELQMNNTREFFDGLKNKYKVEVK